MTVSPPTIGFFDSGVGGLSVLRHALDKVDGQRLLYFADTANAPYGDKSPAWVCQRSREICEFLIEQGAGAIVVACNTATAAAVDYLRTIFTLPIVAMEPAVKPAAALTRSGHIGVLATAGTLGSARYVRLRDRHGAAVSVVERACTPWVALVEELDLGSPHARAMVSAELAPLIAQGVDTLVLGCTHFPFLAETITALLGPDIHLVDPAPAVVQQLRRRLGLVASPTTVPSTLLLFTSGDPQQLQRAQLRLLGGAPQTVVVALAGPSA